MHRILSFLVWSLSSCATLAAIDAASFSSDRIIEKDVVVIGGGASGTYAAVRLREDFNISIALVEPQPRLGGHVETYTVPETGSTIEYGVQSYIRYGAAADFFERFDISITTFGARRLTNINVDIHTGAALAQYSPPANNATTAAFQRWLEIVEKYESITNPGYWDFPAPDAIPSELLVPFGVFAKEHDLEDAAPRIMAISNVGIGGLKDVLTLYVIQAFGAPITRGLLAGDMFVPVGSNSLLYQRAYDLLEDDVLLSTTVKEVKRSDRGVQVAVSRDDDTYLIKAKRILYTAQPGLENLSPFDLDDKEIEVFKTWTHTWSFIGILKIPCIPENYSISYISANAVPDDHLALRDYPYTLRFDSTGPSGLGLFRVLFATSYSISYDEAKQTIVENIDRIVDAGVVNATGECLVEYQAFTDHNGYLWRNTPEQLKDGFVQKLYSLQGYKSTWYTGNTWSAHYSSNVWAYTDTVLPKLLDSLKG